VAANTTLHHFEIALSDVDRGVYETLDLRVAQHPSETMARVLVRTLAYCLSYEDGIAFSKGGLSSPDDPPLSVHDATGMLRVWIEIGAPSAERLHKASKAARVVVYTHELAQMKRQAEGRTIHAADSIEVWSIDPAFVGAIAQRLGRRAKLELTRTDGAIYVTVDGGDALESALVRGALGG
jgi:uncharacterized protein YaeQ